MNKGMEKILDTALATNGIAPSKQLLSQMSPQRAAQYQTSVANKEVIGEITGNGKFVFSSSLSDEQIADLKDSVMKTAVQNFTQIVLTGPEFENKLAGLVFNSKKEMEINMLKAESAIQSRLPDNTFYNIDSTISELQEGAFGKSLSEGKTVYSSIETYYFDKESFPKLGQQRFFDSMASYERYMIVLLGAMHTRMKYWMEKKANQVIGNSETYVYQIPKIEDWEKYSIAVKRLRKLRRRLDMNMDTETMTKLPVMQEYKSEDMVTILNSGEFDQIEFDLDLPAGQFKSIKLDKLKTLFSSDTIGVDYHDLFGKRDGEDGVILMRFFNKGKHNLAPFYTEAGRGEIPVVSDHYNMLYKTRMTGHILDTALDVTVVMVDADNEESLQEGFLWDRKSAIQDIFEEQNKTIDPLSSKSKVKEIKEKEVTEKINKDLINE